MNSNDEKFTRRLKRHVCCSVRQMRSIRRKHLHKSIKGIREEKSPHTFSDLQRRLARGILSRERLRILFSSDRQASAQSE